MREALQYWKKELLRAGKKLILDTIAYTVKNIIASLVEEHLIKKPMKKIFSLNKKWGWEEDHAF